MVKNFSPRKIFFWTHLVIGLAAGGVIAVVAFTGATMAFEKQVIAWAERDLRHVAPPAPGTARIPLSTIIEKLRTTHPDARPAGIVVSADPTEPLTLSLGRTGSLYVNPYTGEAQPSGAKEVRAFFRLMLTWHRWLGVSSPPRTPETPNVGGVPSPRSDAALPATSPPAPGLATPTARPESDNHDHGPASTGLTARQFASSAVGIATIVFLALSVSGLYLWWPRTWSWRALKTTALFNRKLRGKARDWNWHNVIGLWSTPVLIVITFTGIVMAYRPFAAWIYPRPEGQATGGPGGPAVAVPTPAPGAKLLGPDALLAVAQKEIPMWETITLRLGNSQGRGGGRGGRGSSRGPQAASISIRESGWSPMATTLQLDPYTGALLRRSGLSDLSFTQAMRALNRTLHTGEAGGILGQTLAFFACVGGLFLVYTGFALSFRRFFKRSPKRVPVRQTATSPIPATLPPPIAASARTAPGVS